MSSQFEIIETPGDLPVARPDIAGRDRELYGSVDLGRSLETSEGAFQPVVFLRESYCLVAFYKNHGWPTDAIFEKCLKTKGFPAKISSLEVSNELAEMVGLWPKREN